MKRLLLMLPGPMQVPDEVAEAARRPLFFHRSTKFLEFRDRLRNRIRTLAGTEGDVLFLSGPATAAMESAIVNMTSPGEEIIVIEGGAFAERWSRIGRAFGLNVRVQTVDWRFGATVDDVEEAMERWAGARVIYITWSESSTGVLTDLDGIGAAVRKKGKWLVADGVSALAVSPFRMDAWNVDVMIAGSQKGLMMPPGLALVAVGPRGWEKCREARSPRFALDWESFRNGVPSTPPLSLMHQLDAALDLIDAMGPDGVYRRRAAVARQIRGFVGECGLEVYAKRPGDGITAVIVPEGFDTRLFRERLEEDYGILIDGGQGKLDGLILRIGHVGHLTDDELSYFFDSFRKTLAEVCPDASTTP